MNHVLIVDDDVDWAATMRELVAVERFSVAVAHNLRDARRQIAMQRPQLVLLDLLLPDGNGMELFSDPHVPDECRIVLVTGHASLHSSIEALRHGALDYLVKPVGLQQLQDILSRFTKPAAPCPGPAATISMPRSGKDRCGPLLGSSPAMQRIYEQICRVAATSVTVFITGESGTGKEMVAQALHEHSARRAMPFLAINCGAISPHLIESEIFGHEKGSFTGADRQHRGFFERAAGGTLFLDEVTEMPLTLQVKLLRVLETGRFMRVGSTQSQAADVRIIAATNRPPLDAVAAGHLREDLLYRLNVFPIELPPLRERLSDVPQLAQHFLQAIAKREGHAKQFSPAALRQLSLHGWPGNVRELRNAVQRAYVMTAGERVDTQWLPLPLAPVGAAPAAEGVSEPAPHYGTGKTEEACVNLPVGLSLAQAERQLIEATLRRYGNQRERTAAALGISLKTLYNRIKHYTQDDQGDQGDQQSGDR